MTNPYNVKYSPYEQQINPYNNQYLQQEQVYYNNNNSSPVGNCIKGAIVGFTGGTAVAAGIDYFKNRRPVKNGEVKDSFVRRIFDNMIKKNYLSKGKDYIKEKLEIFKNIDSATTPENFKDLLNKYKKCSSSLFDGLSLKTVCETVNSENIKGKISTIKEKIQSSLKMEYQNIKDTVKLCWDSDKKKFVKPKNIDDKLFKIIKNTKNSIDWNKACKAGGITAGILGILALGYSFFTKTPNNSNE